MAVCKECGGERFDHIKNNWNVEYSVVGIFPFGHDVITKESKRGAFWQCRNCKRVFWYMGYGWEPDGKLPPDERKV
jgi:uncharacterized protein with PIN domain